MTINKPAVYDIDDARYFMNKALCPTASDALSMCWSLIRGGIWVARDGRGVLAGIAIEKEQLKNLVACKPDEII